MSSFSGLNTALSSLYAQRRGLDVAGQNIANANTEGYTRQRVVLQSQNSNMVPGTYATSAAVGNGVTVSTVEGVRNAAMDQRSFTEHAASAYHNSRAAAYSSIEDAFGEPSDTGLQARMQDMWDGFNAVATNPDKAAPKAAMIQQATTVAATLNDAATQLNNQFKATRAGLDTGVNEVNKTADSIAQLNKEIVVATAAGVNVNELRDQRGQQMMKLSELVGATATETANGGLNVYIGNAPLVSGFDARKVEIATGSAQRLEDLETTEVNFRWSDTRTAVGPGGQMGASMELVARGGTLQSMTQRLDTVATKLADDVNALHQRGFAMDGSTGTDFFVSNNSKPLSAANISVGITDPEKVAISSGDPTGKRQVLADGTVDDLPPGAARVLDGTIADDIGELATSRTGADAEYQSMIGDLGVSAQSSIRRRDVQNALTDQVDAARDSESGVNLDEEMTNLLTYQRGYEAASRVLTTIDSMLDQLINRTGLVGR